MQAWPCNASFRFRSSHASIGQAASSAVPARAGAHRVGGEDNLDSLDESNSDCEDDGCSDDEEDSSPARTGQCMAQLRAAHTRLSQCEASSDVLWDDTSCKLPLALVVAALAELGGGPRAVRVLQRQIGPSELAKAEQMQLQEEITERGLSGCQALRHVLVSKLGGLDAAFRWIDFRGLGRFTLSSLTAAMLALQVDVVSLTGMTTEAIFDQMDVDQVGAASEVGWARALQLPATHPEAFSRTAEPPLAERARPKLHFLRLLSVAPASELRRARPHSRPSTAERRPSRAAGRAGGFSSEGAAAGRGDRACRKVFDLCAGSRGVVPRAALRALAQDISSECSDDQGGRGPGLVDVQRSLEMVFDATVELQRNMGSQHVGSLSSNFFPLFLQKAAHAVGLSTAALELAVQVGCLSRSQIVLTDEQVPGVLSRQG